MCRTAYNSDSNCDQKNMGVKSYSDIVLLGTVLWAGSGYAEMLFFRQKRAVPLLYGVPPRTYCKPLFARFVILDLSSMYILSTLVYKKQHNLTLTLWLMFRSIILEIEIPVPNLVSTRCKFAIRSCSCYLAFITR